MFDFAVDREKCVHCGACLSACLRGILIDDGEGVPRLNPDNAALCSFCGHCSAVCPENAVVSPGYNGEWAIPLETASPVDFAAARAFILSCRSTRRYKDQAVPKEEVLELLDVARRAPTASNLQAVRWVAINDREKAKRFTALIMDWLDTVARYDPGMSGRYNVDNMLANYRNGYDPILRGTSNAVFALTDKDVVWGRTDAAIALTYFCLAAHARKIGSCWCGFGVTALKTFAPLREFLGLQPNDLVHAMAFFGYPDIVFHAIPPRKPLRLTWV